MPKRDYKKLRVGFSGLPCSECRQIKGPADYYPEILYRCRDCCEQVWERMQRNGREIPEWCLEYSVKEFSYWRSYAQSHHIEYKLIRIKRLEFAGHQCEDCGAKERLQLHHLTYVRIFNELLEDVRILCVFCHRKADALRRKQEKETGSVPPELAAAIRRHYAPARPRAKSVRKRTVARCLTGRS